MNKKDLLNEIVLILHDFDNQKTKETDYFVSKIENAIDAYLAQQLQDVKNRVIEALN